LPLPVAKVPVVDEVVWPSAAQLRHAQAKLWRPHHNNGLAKKKKKIFFFSKKSDYADVLYSGMAPLKRWLKIGAEMTSRMVSQLNRATALRSVAHLAHAKVAKEFHRA